MTLVMASAVLHTDAIADTKWVSQRVTTDADRDFVAAMAYAMCARQHVDAHALLAGIVKTIAEHPKFRSEYRADGATHFESKGLTQMFHEVFKLAETLVRNSIDSNPGISFEATQNHVELIQFYKEMQEVVSRRTEFMAQFGF